MDRKTLCNRIGYEFSEPHWLQRALTHRSHSAAHYERLEFLGDSVLNCAIAHYLFEHHPDWPEGDLSRLRANLVNQKTLSTLASQLELGELLQVGEGERKSAGARRPSILADALEAVFGAVFMDGGFEKAEKVVMGLYLPFIEATDISTLGRDAKTLLQEFLQGRRLKLPKYAVVATEGAAHAQSFRVECRVEGLKVASLGEGSTRRAAEQAAAEAALRQIQDAA